MSAEGLFTKINDSVMEGNEIPQKLEYTTKLPQQEEADCLNKVNHIINKEPSKVKELHMHHC